MIFNVTSKLSSNFAKILLNIIYVTVQSMVSGSKLC